LRIRWLRHETFPNFRNAVFFLRFVPLYDRNDFPCCLRVIRTLLSHLTLVGPEEEQGVIKVIADLDPDSDDTSEKKEKPNGGEVASEGEGESLRMHN
jgi:hypothetical protein